MKIAVIGMGLIGGSFCKAISKRTNNFCYGMDTNSLTIEKALQEKSIISEITTNQLCEMDIVIVCLHPVAAVNFMLENKNKFKKNGVIIDSCGVKEEIVNLVSQEIADCGAEFLGAHPMAGLEFSGYDYAVENLFDRASFIITPTEKSKQETVNLIKELSKEIGFNKTVIASPHEHDTVIAFTSQLAHVVSNAYIKSPSLEKEIGFSAGSFLDLTRVAKLNSSMWTELFMMNKKALLYEIDTIIESLSEYKYALETQNSDKLKNLLQIGSDLKENSMKKHGGTN